MPTAREQQIDAAAAAYLENADYAEVNSAVKAAAFATAWGNLLFLLPKRTAQGAEASWTGRFLHVHGGAVGMACSACQRVGV